MPTPSHRLMVLAIAGTLQCTLLLPGNAYSATNGTMYTSGLIFQDSFASGDLSAHSAYFRWGDGTTMIQPGQVTMPVVSVKGPGGAAVKAIQFNYGTWQEVRFALTQSATEMRAGANGSSNVAYPDVYTCYDLFIPTNYFQSSTGVGAVNDKWFAIYKDGYQTSNSGVANWFELLPDGTGNSIATATDNTNGGLNKNVSYVISSDAAQGGSEAYGVRTSESGQWHQFCYHTLVPTNATSNDGKMEVYKDGTLHYAWDNIKYWAPDGVAAQAGFDRGYLLGYHNSVVPNGTQTWYLTNFKIGTTAASVGLSGSGSTTSPTSVQPDPPGNVSVN
jgi:hypothetical protein